MVRAQRFSSTPAAEGGIADSIPIDRCGHKHGDINREECTYPTLPISSELSN